MLKKNINYKYGYEKIVDKLEKIISLHILDITDIQL